MPQERYRHIFLPGPPVTRRFTSPQHGGSSPRIPDRDRAQHARLVEERLRAAWQAAENRQAVAHADRHGVYLDFYSEPGFDLVLKSLEARRSGIRLLNVTKQGTGAEERTRAAVYVPREKISHFLRRVSAYATETVTPRNEGEEAKPKNAKLVESIADVRAAVLESFWQDQAEFLPGDTSDWIEVWLSSEDLGVIERFGALCHVQQIEMGQGRIVFPERTVCLVNARRNDLSRLLELSDDIAEFRSAKEVATFFIEQENRDQAQWVTDLLNRMELRDRDQICVLVLDHGVNNGHRLLEPVLADEDRHTVEPAWGVSDDHGHGTLMAGTAAYGDILALLQSNGAFVVSHGLESAKILPPPPATNPKRLWGHYTAQGISRAEVQAPARKRITCMAVTSVDDRDRGRPSSWSGRVDELASGYDDDPRRLIIVSAGNITDPEEWRGYPESNLTNEVHDPAQAWNALTIGAFTTKTQIRDQTLAGFTAKADAGNLSPFSTTSLSWPARRWPIKPEVLFEGGNVAVGPNDGILDPDDLKLLSTYRDPQVAQFAPFCGTSAAAAQAAWMAAKILAQYPDAWPETIRGLIVHTAEWTPAQKRDFLPDQSKAAYARLLRICGYGVADFTRALYCAANSLTLISQAQLQPFDKHATQSRYISRDMHLYRLPWPVEVLQGLGAIPVKMRVTLSYFVEPSPGEVGWQDRYRYASHALRFEFNGPGESEEDFVQRVNRLAREEDEHPGTEGPGDRWTIGEARNVGSIHSDIWQGSAIELAASNLIAVHPTVGWWRERHHLNRWNKQTRYTLLVSIHLPEQNVDIYTPVSVQIGVPIPIQITVPIA
jgi:hypothetical protein